MAQELERPKGPFNDQTDHNLQIADYGQKVSDRAVKNMRQAIRVAIFDKDAFARRISADIARQVRREMRGKLASEIDSEIKYRAERETEAIGELEEGAVEVCAGFNIMPSQYLLYKAE